MRVKAVYPQEVVEALPQAIKEIDLGKDEADGITRRAIKSGQSQLVGNVRTDPDYKENGLETQSKLVVPIKIGEDVIGIINVEHPDTQVFNEEDQHTLEALAAQAAIAIQNAQLNKETQRRALLLATALDVARDATAVSNIDELLDQAVALISSRFGFYHSAIFLIDKLRRYAVLRSASSERGQAMLKNGYQRKIGDIGIVSYVAESGQARITLDVDKDDLYFDNPYLPDTHSEIAIPLQIEGQLIGVLDVQSTEFNAFNDDDKTVLQTVANQLAISIKRMDQLNELKQTQNLVGSRTALAWMGMVSSDWRHAIGNHATTIEDYVELAREDITDNAPGSKILGRLERINDIVKKIRNTPITAPLLSEEGVRSINIHEVLYERIKQMWEREQYCEITLDLDFKIDGPVTVRVSPDWLRRVFDTIIENAVDAMSHVATKQIAIGTRLENDRLVITVKDNGHGIPYDVMPLLFNRSIPKPKGSKGLGMGLLMAHLIIQTYGGDLYVDHTDACGTTMKIWLPIEN
ncbi:MAG: GAF domain-containing protein [Anaerolineales bacterium]